MKNSMVIMVIVAIVFAGVGFFGGMKYKQFQRGTNSFQQQFRQKFGNNANSVRGQVIRNNNGNLTIKLQDGSTKIVIVPSSATIYKTDNASISDLKNNEEVLVFGTENSDGSITAQNVQLNPRERLSSPAPTK